MIRILLEGVDSNDGWVVPWPHVPPEGATVEFRGARLLVKNVLYGHAYTEDDPDINTQVVTITLGPRPEGG